MYRSLHRACKGERGKHGWVNIFSHQGPWPQYYTQGEKWASATAWRKFTTWSYKIQICKIWPTRKMTNTSQIWLKPKMWSSTVFVLIMPLLHGMCLPPWIVSAGRWVIHSSCCVAFTQYHIQLNSLCKWTGSRHLQPVRSLWQLGGLSFNY